MGEGGAPGALVQRSGRGQPLLHQDLAAVAFYARWLVAATVASWGGHPAPFGGLDLG